MTEKINKLEELIKKSVDGVVSKIEHPFGIL
ncbi:hypothetical protein LCGC14_2458070, partial [marine sediment metagenome]